MDSRWARVARGWSAATFAILVAAVSHTLAGGTAPSAFALAVSLIMAGAICTAFTARRMSLPLLIPAVGLSQFLFHAVFSGLASPVVASHHMGSMTVGSMSLPQSPSTMWLGHAVAAVVTVVAVRRGESAFWSLLQSAHIAFALLFAARVPVISTPPRPAIVDDRVFSPRDPALLLGVMRHRGPPAVFAQ